MPSPVADNARLLVHVTDVLRAQAREAAQLARDLRGDDDVADALEGMVGRVRDTARALGLVHVERAALRALRAVRGPDRGELLDELVEVCSGGARVTPLLRPIVVVSGGQDTESLHRAVQSLAATVRMVPDLESALQVAQHEDASAVVVPVGQLTVRPPGLEGRLLLAYGREEDLPSRQIAARAGAVSYLPEPLDLGLVVRLVRRRLAAWRAGAWRVLVAHASRARVEDLAAALANEELHPIAAAGGFRLLQAIEEAGADLLVVAPPLENLPLGELNAVLAAHHRFSALPVLHLWEGGAVPAALTGHDVVQGELDIPALRARILATLDDHRRVRAARDHDELTGCAGPTAILHAADREIAVARRRGDPLVAVRFELDDPTALDASIGPSAAEAALRHLARAIAGTVRESDSVGVISASGCLLLLPGCTAVHARDRILAVRQRFALRVAGDERLAEVGFSVGVAEGVDDLLLRAEWALLRAAAASREGDVRAPAEVRRRLDGIPRVGPDIER